MTKKGPLVVCCIFRVWRWNSTHLYIYIHILWDHFRSQGPYEPIGIWWDVRVLLPLFTFRTGMSSRSRCCHKTSWFLTIIARDSCLYLRPARPTGQSTFPGPGLVRPPPTHTPPLHSYKNPLKYGKPMGKVPLLEAPCRNPYKVGPY